MQTLNKWIIFHADDFNLTSGVNKGIIDAYKNGVVRSTSIMPNIPNFDESVELLNENPGLDIGVHINLTFGRPISDPSEVPSLVDDSGIFWRRPAMLADVADFEEMKKEILRQMEVCLDAGLKPTHIDTHHHLHRSDPRALEILCELAVEHKMAVRSVNQEMRDYIMKKGIPTPDNFNGDFYNSDNITIESLERVIRTAPDGFSEIMCHPGVSDDELMDISTYNKCREAEIKTLCHPRIWQAIQDREAKLIGYLEMLEFFPGFERHHKPANTSKEKFK
ncbi:MAG: ChbG/HpnK family deacetylase [Firmicutes bacterium]|nr:ChbG/HpnK family deacetylase [Bacillota bacterium]